MKCTACGHNNIAGANYCANCNQSFKNNEPDNDDAVTLKPITPADSTEKPSPAAPTVATAQPGTTAPVAPTAPINPITPAPQSYPTSQTTPTVSASYPAAPAYPYSTAPANAPPRTAPVAPAAPYYPQQPYYYKPATPQSTKPFTITDAYIIIGFVLAVIGIFAYSFLLLPASIAFSVIGFIRRTNARTLGLSIAGIVVGVVAVIIRIGMILHDLGFIPDWLSAGILT